MKKFDFITWALYPGLCFTSHFSSGFISGLNSSEACNPNLFHMKQVGSDNQPSAFFLSGKRTAVKASGIVL
jgi:hypothetical protein